MNEINSLINYIRNSIYLRSYFGFLTYFLILIFSLTLLETIPRIKDIEGSPVQFLLLIPIAIILYLGFVFSKKPEKIICTRKGRRIIVLHWGVLFAILFVSIFVLGNSLNIMGFVAISENLKQFHLNNYWYLIPFGGNFGISFILIFLLWSFYLSIFNFVFTYKRIQNEYSDSLNSFFEDDLELSFIDTNIKKNYLIDEIVKIKLLILSKSTNIEISEFKMVTNKINLVNYTAKPIYLSPQEQKVLPFEIIMRGLGKTHICFVVRGELNENYPHPLVKKIYRLRSSLKKSIGIPINIYPLQPSLVVEYSNKTEYKQDELITLNFRISNNGKGVARKINVNLKKIEELRFIQDFGDIQILTPESDEIRRDIILEPVQIGKLSIPFNITCFDDADNKIESIEREEMNFEIVESLVQPVRYSSKITKIEQIIADDFQDIFASVSEEKKSKLKALWKEIMSGDITKAFEIEENEYFDRKKEKTNANKMKKIIVAMANTYGGIIVFGIDDDLNSNLLTRKQRDNLENFISNICNTNIRPAIFPIFKTILENKNLGYLVVLIPQYQNSYYLTDDGRILRRSGSNNVPISVAELNRSS